jgi:uncharacterized iron-regulated membrane protein
MSVRRLHRVLGLALLLPILAWAATGFVFFVKPGYKDAYAALRVRALPLAEPAPIAPPAEGWLETRRLRTVLGEHLLVRTGSGWSHLDPVTLRTRALPGDADLRALIEDAMAGDAARYGRIASLVREDGAASATTTTGVAIDLDWATLSLSQSGRDTRRIDALYSIHYLQWTGIAAVDRVLGGAGLVSLLALAVFGLRLALPRRRLE